MTNGGFDQDLSGWENPWGNRGEWNSLDAAGSASSGSALLYNEGESNGGVPTVLVQCYKFRGDGDFEWGGQVRVLPGQPNGTSAQIFIATYNTDNCAGESLERSSVGSPAVGSWLLVNKRITASISTSSIGISLGVLKPSGETATASGYFDNVFLRQSDTGFRLIDERFSGSWYNPDFPGQGIIIDISRVIKLFFGGWYTWTTTPGEIDWMTLQGEFTGELAKLKIYRSSGGKFVDPAAVTTVPVGVAEIRFISCTEAEFFFQFDGEANVTTVPLTRLTPPFRGCEEE